MDRVLACATLHKLSRVGFGDVLLQRTALVMSICTYTFTYLYIYIYILHIFHLFN